ncbi:hypothetical protein AVEN_108476-1 [Araneus ventricosus]|uniref:RNase H type-1 domain-containing protein n=1 Tax=Araneus ventricosus TaxID=182803 RepID=A0A4Y2Q2D6_ARAVE|nr:hypothetical protein AVEN_108476-1 [Araneus ventricosus]
MGLSTISQTIQTIEFNSEEVSAQHHRSIFHYANSCTIGHRRDHTAPHQSRTGSGLRQNSQTAQNINFNPNNYEDGTTSTKFHPAIFQLEDRISLKKQFLPVPGLDIYTDGSKIEDKTGSAFCIMEEDITKYEWMAQLPFNTVFQAELLSIQEACLWASKSNQQIMV